MSANPFAALCAEIVAETPLRAAITAAYRRPEPECVAALIEGATLKPDQAKAGRSRANWSSACAARRGRAASRGSSTNIRCRARRAWR